MFRVAEGRASYVSVYGELHCLSSCVWVVQDCVRSKLAMSRPVVTNLQSFIKIYVMGTGCEGGRWMALAQVLIQWWASMLAVFNPLKTEFIQNYI
jgi:hypothetical protein